MTKPENGEEEGEAKAGSGAEEEAEEEGEDEEIGDEIVNALLSVISMDMIEGEKDEDEGEAWRMFLPCFLTNYTMSVSYVLGDTYIFRIHEKAYFFPSATMLAIV